VPLLAFCPYLFLFVTTPGADAAMYAAIARALLQGSPDLSAAYPGVQVAMYPRAYAGLIAVLTPSLGMPKACLLAAALSYVVFVMGLSLWLRKVIEPRAALIVALLITLAGRNVPLGFFSWGGNPTIMAFGMALSAIALAADAVLVELTGYAALLLAGAFAVHPIGAISGAACAPLVLLCPRLCRYRAARVLGCALLALPLAAAFKRFGPAISARETEWIARWQLGPAALLRQKNGSFALDYLHACQHALGVVLSSVACISIWVVLRKHRQHRQLVWLTAAGLAYVAALVALGPRLPSLGSFIYADRLPPIWLVVIAPPIAIALSELRTQPKRLLLTASLVTIALAHANWQNGEPLLSADELALTDCIRSKVPRNAWIVASYGQGGQWLPALTGNPVTQAHTHCTLFDETDAQRPHIAAQYQLLSRHAAQYVPALPELPALETVCEHGGAKLTRLAANAPPIPGVY